MNAEHEFLVFRVVDQILILDPIALIRDNDLISEVSFRCMNISLRNSCSAFIFLYVYNFSGKIMEKNPFA